MHDGHRQRLKQRFLEQGLSSLPNHNTLELLLFFTIPRKDTNEIAHELINNFGSLSAVFDAPIEELVKVKGIGENSATLIKFIPEMYGQYLEDKIKNTVTIDSSESAGEYFVSKFIGVNNERVFILCLDNKGSVINCDMVSEGSVKMAEITGRKVIEKALKNNASSVVLSHNHPGGVPVPSKNDVKTTLNLVNTLNSIDVKLIDHIIVADGEYFSMADCDKYTYMFL